MASPPPLQGVFLALLQVLPNPTYRNFNEKTRNDCAPHLSTLRSKGLQLGSGSIAHAVNGLNLFKKANLVLCHGRQQALQAKRLTSRSIYR